MRAAPSLRRAMTLSQLAAAGSAASRCAATVTAALLLTMRARTHWWDLRRVTWKADGTRYLLLLRRDGVFAIDRKPSVRRADRLPQALLNWNSYRRMMVSLQACSPDDQPARLDRCRRLQMRFPLRLPPQMQQSAQGPAATPDVHHDTLLDGAKAARPQNSRAPESS